MLQVFCLLCKLGNLKYKDEIISALPTLIALKQVLYFLDIIVLIVLMFMGKIRFNKKKEIKKLPLVLCSIFIIVSCNYYHFIPEAIELVNGFIYNKQNSVRYGSIYGYHFEDILKAINNKKDIQYDSYEEMIKYYNLFKEDEKQNYSIDEMYNGIAKGKNVIIVQLESVQNFVVDRKINGQEITPNLNKFLNENIKITNMHSSSYTTTADSEHSFITSTYPTENGEAFSKYYSNAYDNIYTQLKKEGYNNIYAHGNFENFWNRRNVYSKMPIDKTYFLDDFEDTSELIRTYLSDELFYRQMVENLSDEKVQSPFCATLIASSSHKPFDLEGIISKEEKVKIDVGDYKDTNLGNYLESMNYMDYAFGILVDELKNVGLYEDTVIIVFGDHYGMSMYDEDLIKFLDEDVNNYNDARMQKEFSNVACGIRIPGLSGILIDKPTNKIDIKPTLMQIMGIEDGFSIGCTIFSSKDYVCINNGKIITNDYLYDGEWKKLANGEKVDEKMEEQLEYYVKKMEIELGISKSVVVKNLLNER